MDNKISCIIPAFNEEGRITKTINLVKDHPLIKEIIVINDCSTDKTLKEIKKYKNIKIINNKYNIGKTASVMKGLKLATNNLVLMLDADLNFLTKKNITNLILPVLENKVDVTLALMKNPLLFRIIGADSASGQRVFNKQIIPIDKLNKLENYGFECFMNDEILKNEYRIKIVNWTNVISTTKSEKLGRISSVFAYFSMWKQMIKTVGFKKFIFQSFNLLKLNIKN